MTYPNSLSTCLSKDNFESDEPCLCCGLSADGMVCYHHIYRRKSRPDLKHKTWNKAPVCLMHHNEWHSSTNTSMKGKYSGISDFFDRMGWYMESGKMVHPGAAFERD